MEKYTNKYNVVTALLCVVCCCFFLSACSGSNHAGTGKQAAFVDFNAIEKEYLNTLKKLNWPEGYSLPTKMDGNEEDRAASYQSGWGDTCASTLWECVWMKEWLKSYRTDAKRANTAIQELEKAFTMPYMNPPACDDATRRFLRDCIDKAKLGDPSGFEENVKLNCPE